MRFGFPRQPYPRVNTLIKRTLGFLAIHWLEPTLSAKCFLSENVWAGFGAFCRRVTAPVSCLS